MQDTLENRGRLLVTGASGFLGWHACEQAQAAGWQVIGVAHAHDAPMPVGVQAMALNLTDATAVRAAFTAAHPAAVLHLAAASDPNWCQSHPQESAAINVTAAIHLTALCAAADIPCVFTSTDLVFDGRHAPYAESAAPNPVNLYGEQKQRVEEAMRRDGPRGLVCRVPLLFGDSGPGRRNTLAGLMEALSAGKPVNLFVDEFRTPASGRAVAGGLLLALHTGTRLLHLGGPERLSRYEFGVRFARYAGLDPAGIRASRQAEVQQAAPRPADVSLDSSKAFALGYRPLPLEEEFRHAYLPGA